MEARGLVDLPQSRRNEERALKRRFRWARLLWIPAALFLGVALRQIDFPAIWEVLRKLQGTQVVVLVGLNGLVLSLFALRWRLGLYAFRHEVKFILLLAYRLAGFGVSYFTPGPQVGGEPLQIYLLNRREQIPSAAALASVFLDRMVDMLANFTFLVVGLIAVGLVGMHPETIGRWGWLAAGSVLILPLTHLGLLRRNRRPLTLVGGWLSTRFTRSWLVGIVRIVTDMENQIGLLIEKQPGTLLKMLAVSGLSWIASIAEFGLLLRFLGLEIGFLQLLSIIAMVRLAFMLPIPAGLGVMEAGLVWGVQLAGYQPAAGIAAALVIRARDITLGAIGLWLGGWLARSKG